MELILNQDIYDLYYYRKTLFQFFGYLLFQKR